MAKKNTSNVTEKERIEVKKNGDTDGKALYKLMNNAVYGETIRWKAWEIELK